MSTVSNDYSYVVTDNGNTNIITTGRIFNVSDQPPPAPTNEVVWESGGGLPTGTRTGLVFYVQDGTGHMYAYNTALSQWVQVFWSAI